MNTASWIRHSNTLSIAIKVTFYCNVLQLSIFVFKRFHALLYHFKNLGFQRIPWEKWICFLIILIYRMNHYASMSSIWIVSLNVQYELPIAFRTKTAFLGWHNTMCFKYIIFVSLTTIIFLSCSTHNEWNKYSLRTYGTHVYLIRAHFRVVNRIKQLTVKLPFHHSISYV